MAIRVIKLGRKDDIASVIKQIKSLKDREVIFELERGSALLASSDNLKLLRRVGEALGKTIKVQTNDQIGQVLAKKAGVLVGELDLKPPKPPAKVARSDIKPRFSDILGPRKAFESVLPVPTKDLVKKLNPISAISSISSAMKLPVADRFSGSFLKMLAVFAVVLLLLTFVLAILLPKAEITVLARSEPVTRDLEITVDKSFPGVDSDALKIRGIPVSKDVSQTKSFQTTGKKRIGTKASGAVTIYNSTPNILKLRLATTTLVFEGKKYLLVADASGIKPNNVPTTGIAIVAEQGGEEYNLPANTRFQIVNAALGNQNVHAVSSSPISGGAVGTPVKVILQEDLDNAAIELANEITAAVESDLSAENSATIKLIDTGLKKEILAKTANKDAGDEVENFSMTLIAKVTGLAFREDDVTYLVLGKINDVLSTDKYILSSGKKQYTAGFKSVDLTAGRGVLGVHFETVAAYKVDASNFSSFLVGKNESEIKEILSSKPEIDDVRVEFWPSWLVHKAPRFNGKIEIHTEIAESGN